MSIYPKVLKELLKDGVLSQDDRILVVCGGSFDAKMLSSLGFTDAMITNVDDQYDGRCAPYEWSFADAENLPFEESAFDWAVVHAGLHHCVSPHRGLLEMMRVARKGVIVLEARDSLLMKLAVRMGLTPEYELESVLLHPQLKGGVRDTGIPNFIYRWTESEVRKTVESARPGEKNEYRFFYGLGLPLERYTMYGATIHTAMKFAGIGARLLHKIFPRQGNEFAFVVSRSGSTKPWIRSNDGELEIDPSYNVKFDVKKYRRNAA